LSKLIGSRARQERFCNEYLLDLNAGRAAVRAGYSENGCQQAGSRLLARPYIAARIEELQAKREARTQVTQDRVLKELAAIGFADIADYAGIEDGAEGQGQVITLKNTADLPAEKRAAIAGMRQGTKGIEIKLCDKLKALELMARHLGMMRDKLEIEDAREVKVLFHIPRSKAAAKKTRENHADLVYNKKKG